VRDLGISLCKVRRKGDNETGETFTRKRERESMVMRDNWSKQSWEGALVRRPPDCRNSVSADVVHTSVLRNFESSCT
jgi:hypothetical protein